jgi:hypothetical protein
MEKVVLRLERAQLIRTGLAHKTHTHSASIKGRGPDRYWQTSK